jgi:hypothetical protein
MIQTGVFELVLPVIKSFAIIVFVISTLTYLNCAFEYGTHTATSAALSNTLVLPLADIKHCIRKPDLKE